MRTLDLDRPFDGIIAWCSLFHLTPADQRMALPRLLRCGPTTASCCSTPVVPRAGDRDGEWRGEPLYHASLALAAYEEILEQAGFATEPWTSRTMSASAHACD